MCKPGRKWESSWYGLCLLPASTSFMVGQLTLMLYCCGPQESIKTKHPQLLYESKLYKILQGASTHLPSISSHCP